MSGPIRPEAPDLERVKAGVAQLRAAGASDGDVDAYVSEALGTPSQVSPGAGRSLVDHLVNGLSFGLARKAGAAMASVVHKGNLSEYDNNLAAINAALAGETNAHGIASRAGELAGAVLSPANALLPGGGSGLSIAGRAAAAARAGAVGGALSSMGNTDGGAADYLLAGTTGAVAGGVLGGVLGAGAAKLTKAGRYTPSAEARVLLPAMQAAESSPAQLAAAPPDMLADAMPDLTRTVRSMSGKARQTIDPALTARSAQQIPEIQTALEDALGVERGSVKQSVADIVARRDAAAAPNYQKAYAGPDVSHPVLDDAYALPQFKAAWRRGQRIAKTEGNTIANLPTPVTAGQISDDMVPTSLKGNPAAVEQFKQMLIARGQMPETPPASYSVRGIDYSKRGLDDFIDSRMRAGKMGRAEARALRDRLAGVLQTTDELNPDYGAARAEYAGPSQLVDASELGAEHFAPGSKTDGSDVASALSGFDTPGEAALYRRSGINAILTALESARGSATGRGDMVDRFYSSIGGRDKVSALFPTKDAADAFHTAMDQLATQNAARRFITGGSQTADKAAAQVAFADADAARQTADAVRAGPYKAIKTFLGDRVERAIRVGTQQSAERVAPALVKTGPELAALLKLLQAVPDQAARSAAIRAALAGRAGSAVAPPLVRGLLFPD